MILHGDSLEVLKTLDENSVDAVVTDPPYGLSFMGKKWDYDVPSVELWREVFRVMKPGAHLLSFGGTRTYHRMVCALEDGGFEIRDQVQWIYGSGFPKSHDVSKGIDKAAGAEPVVVGDNPNNRPSNRHGAAGFDSENEIGSQRKAELKITAPATDAAKQWQGWGTALKPANEPIVLARKPLSESTVAKNVLKWGTSGLNIDASRIETQERLSSGRHTTGDQQGPSGYKTTNRTEYQQSAQGRWPANILFDESAAEMLDEQSGQLKSGDIKKNTYANMDVRRTEFHTLGKQYSREVKPHVGDSGGASRFFYVAKASKRERNEGLEEMPKFSKSHLASPDGGGGGWSKDTDKNPNLPRANHHPTVKPIKLMEYLCKLITPPNGTILDPFTGSGSTGVAATRLGFKFIGIEKEAEYVEIAKRRIENESQQEQLDLVD